MPKIVQVTINDGKYKWYKFNACGYHEVGEQQVMDLSGDGVMVWKHIDEEDIPEEIFKMAMEII